MLPGKKHDAKKGQRPQRQQAETLPAFLVIHFTLQPRVVNVLNKINFRVWSAAHDGLVARTAIRTGKTHCNCSHNPLLSSAISYRVRSAGSPRDRERCRAIPFAASPPRATLRCATADFSEFLREPAAPRAGSTRASGSHDGAGETHVSPADPPANGN